MVQQEDKAMIVDELIQTTALARDYLDKSSQRSILRFVRSCWNSDGGVRGRNSQSDLCYTAYAAICMRALHGRMPLLRLWKYLHSFGDGTSLDITHLFCLIRLYTIFPMSEKMRQRLLDLLDAKDVESSSDMFFKVIMAEYLKKDDRPDVQLTFSKSDITSDIAAAVVVNHRPDKEAEDLLMQRYCKAGGFRSSTEKEVPDLFSTATTLFALRMMNTNLSVIRSPCLEFIKSLQRDSGGFAGHATDSFEDTEQTFYALISMGSLT